MKRLAFVAALGLLAAPALAQEATQDATMSFFVTSANPGKGGDLGGLAGADAYCAKLAESAGVTEKSWKAYLSTDAENARDRIGAGPWHNVKGVKIAEDVANLHSDANNLNKETALDEKGNVINGRGDTPNDHDILTGSKADGTAAPETCNNWTSDADDAKAIVGHHDRIGLNESAPMKSWNSSHPSAGCTNEAFKKTGGAGLFYCFAAN